MQKRVAAIHDISCFGKCSLTVALPIISTAGIEVCVIPTAILSTHTGGFSGFTYRDLTDDIGGIAGHWQTLPIHFDAVYTGFLGSVGQVDIVCDVFRQLRSFETLLIVDPVMADNGELYSTFPPDFPKAMRRLCSKADIIIPNMTEAALLLDEPYLKGPYGKAFVEDQLIRLSTLGPKHVVLTGVHFDDSHIGAAVYEQQTGIFEYAFSERIKGIYHGTGDVFASVLVAATVHGLPLADAVKTAVEFTVQSIRRTHDAGTDPRFGINFEQSLPELMRRLSLL